MSNKPLITELTDEQKEQLAIAAKQLVAASLEMQEQLLKAFAPLMKAMSDFYNSIPEDLRKELAKDQADEVIEKVEKQAFIKSRLDEYAKLWNPEKQVFEVESDWTPTREELLADLEKSWEFENGRG